MTTVGVDTRNYDQSIPASLPQYSYQQPTLRRVQIAAVKEGIFHPKLPTIRQMSRDSYLQKLPDEHCRSSTSCGPDDFKRSTSSYIRDPEQKLHSLTTTNQGRQLLANGLETPKYEFTPVELKKARENWSDLLTRAPERYSIRLPELPENANTPFTGYAVRYLKPDVTGAWRYSLRQEPTLDQYGQRPIPANIYARYRDTHPQYARNAAAEAWR